MSKVSDVIEKGEAIPEPDEVVHYRIPGDASPLTLCGLDVWADDTSVTERAGSSNCTACRAAADEGQPKSRTVRVTMALDIEERDGKAVISTHEGEIGSCDSAVFLATVAKEFGVTIAPTPGPSVLSLPTVPDGTIAIVGTESRRRWEFKGGRTPWFLREEALFTDLAGVLVREGSVTVVMREPRTWPKLDGAPEDVKAFHGDSGRLYTRSTIGGEANVRPLYYPAVAQFEQHKAAAARPMSHWREVDGPLTEVLVDEPGGEPR